MVEEPPHGATRQRVVLEAEKLEAERGKELEAERGKELEAERGKEMGKAKEARKWRPQQKPFY
jgi:hypothetical protein